MSRENVKDFPRIMNTEKNLSLSHVCLCAKLRQLGPTLCSPMDCSPPGSSAYGILHQEHWTGFPCPSPEDLPHPGIKARFLVLRADALPKNNSVLSKNYYIPKVLNSISFDLKGRSNTSNPNKHQELATTWLYQDKGLNQDGRVEKGMALLLFNVSLSKMTRANKHTGTKA